MDHVGKSVSRIPAAVDPENWKPLTTEEKELFDTRLEHYAKTRRRFWTMKYNPKTMAYFSEVTSDRGIYLLHK